jgi:hypothetical protein
MAWAGPKLVVCFSIVDSTHGRLTIINGYLKTFLFWNHPGRRKLGLMKAMGLGTTRHTCRGF